MRFSLVLSLVTLLFFSCKKDSIVKPEPLPQAMVPTDTNGYLKIQINNTVNGSGIDLTGATSYTNNNGDSFTVSKLLYYISNVELHTNSGDTFKEIESYYLVDESNSNSLQLMVKGVPKGDYHSISFLIGVDSTRNVSGAQTGALDPANGMFWTWSSGYIMAKMEGSSPQSGAANQGLAFHIAGFSGVNSGIRKINLSFPNLANVTKNHTPVLNLNGDLDKWFFGTTTISFATVHTVTTISGVSKSIADNYTNMFSVISVVN